MSSSFTSTADVAPGELLKQVPGDEQQSSSSRMVDDASSSSGISGGSRVQTRLSAATSQGDFTQLIMAEHRVVETLYWEYQNEEDINIKQAKVHLMIKELSQHSAKEELALYPVMKSRLPNGPEMVAHALQEHQAVKEELLALDQMQLREQGQAQQLDKRLRKLMDDVLHHVEEEERDLLPALAAALSPAEGEAVARHFLSAAALAPSRPHPELDPESRDAPALLAALKQSDALRDTARPHLADQAKPVLGDEAFHKPSGDSAAAGGKDLDAEMVPNGDEPPRRAMQPL